MFPPKTALAKQPRAVGIGGCAAQVSMPGGVVATAFGALVATPATARARALTGARRLLRFETISFVMCASSFGAMG
jgi:hypothetical protein